MRILLVNYRYFISGGPEKYMFNVKKLLEENGHEVIPFSVNSSKNIETEYLKYFVEPIGNRDAVYFDEVKKTPKSILQMISRSVYSFSVKKAIQKEIKEVKPDLVYIIHFVNKLSPSVIIGAKQLGIPVVVRLSDFFMLCPRFDFLCKGKICEDCTRKGYSCCVKRRCVKNSLAASVIRSVSMKIHEIMRIYDKVDAFVCPSSFLRDKMIENGYAPEKLYHIPTFTDMKESVLHADKKKIACNSERYGLYFGRISKEKGVFSLVKAYSHIQDKKLVIMGDDSTDEAQRIKKFVENKSLQNIEFVGFKTGIELEDIIENSSFVVIPSIWYDNLPNTALEAFKHSKPVIASRIGSLSELVKDGYNGYLFKPDSVRDLMRVIKLIDDEKSIAKMGENCHNMLMERFSPDMHYRRLLDLFEGVIKRNNGKEW